MAQQKTKQQQRSAPPQQAPADDGQSKGQLTIKEKADNFRTQLDRALPQITPLLPPGVPANAFKSMVVSTVLRNPKLLDCERGSLLQAVSDAAEMGLSLNPNMKEADILPVYKGPNKQVAQLRPRAIGLMKLAMETKVVTKVWSHVVYENDDFHYQLGLHKDLHHQPLMNDEERGAMLQQAYCCWETVDGVRDFEIIGARRIARAREASQSYKAYKEDNRKSSPWVTDEEEMIRKTAVIAASKYMPKTTASERFQKAVALATDADFEPVGHQPEIVEGNQAILPPKKERPPRPTRKQREAAEQAEREMDARYRETMGGGPMGEDPPLHEDGGVVIEHDPNPKQDEGKAQARGKKADKPKEEPKPADYKALAAEIMKLIVKATGIPTIDAIVERYAEDLNAMQVEDPTNYKLIKDGLDGKRKAFSQK